MNQSRVKLDSLVSKNLHFVLENRSVRKGEGLQDEDFIAAGITSIDATDQGAHKATINHFASFCSTGDVMLKTENDVLLNYAGLNALFQAPSNALLLATDAVIYAGMQ